MSMYVKQPIIIARPALSGFADALTSIGQGLWNVAATSGQNQSMQQQMLMQQQMAMQNQGLLGGSTGTLLLLGGLGIGLVLLLKKKKKT